MSNKAKTVKIMFDYMQGPIWISDIETGEPLTGIDIIDNDSLIKELNFRCAEIYNNYYNFDDKEGKYIFDYDREKSEKFILLNALNRLISRLNELNDGSFTIDDCETERIRKL